MNPDKELHYSLYELLISEELLWRYSRHHCITLSQDNEYKLSRLIIAKIVPNDAPLTLENLADPADDLSEGFLEVYRECYKTIGRVYEVFVDYLFEELYTSVNSLNWLKEAQLRVESILKQRRAEVLQTIVGSTDNEIQKHKRVSASCNILMASERVRIADRLNGFQNYGVSALSPFTQARISTLDNTEYYIADWCEKNSRAQLPHRFRECSEPTIETLIYLINFNALVALKLDLINFALSRFLGEEERSLPSGSWENHDIGTLRAQPDWNGYRTSSLPQLKVSYLQKVEKYKNDLARILETLLPLNIATIEKVNSELKKFIARGVSIDVADLSPELGIFLQLCPSDIPPQYSQLAEKVHSFRLDPSADDDIFNTQMISYSELHRDAVLYTLTPREYETTSREPWYSAYHFAGLPEPNSDIRNDVASVDMSTTTIAESNQGKQHKVDVAGSSSSSKHGRVGSRGSHGSSGNQELYRWND
ncbi:hypothetical protein SeMB42_g06149 [Synchytrium endobioticum]|uniref:Uncharacterized protein n=1 Tax=Synchytrium endobioticum TaxID=286115 RepID=A0A507D9D7_9FUNG|nr:hypothetical protein SeMB42_g06149 [Synchytrium endobioticum]TPX48188.1 hypothetical protein SeLEV6574_g02156 [Synchytrium endobioticum]TPX48212.1 hypothetical protein SeLEV6574_g02183 [Synchytrium endobioticum]